MKIIIEREVGSITFKTYASAHTHHVRQMLKDALLLEGYCKEDVAEVLNIQEDKIQPCRAEEEVVVSPEITVPELELGRHTFMMFGKGNRIIPVIVSQLSSYASKEDILKNVTEALEAQGETGYGYIPEYDVATTKGFVEIIKSTNSDINKPACIYKFMQMEILIYNSIETAVSNTSYGCEECGYVCKTESEMSKHKCPKEDSGIFSLPITADI